MTEQGITQEDQEWIDDRYVTDMSIKELMRAAIARGYERGRRDVDLPWFQECQDAHSHLNAAGVDGRRADNGGMTIAERVNFLIADRDRLAKRYEELREVGEMHRVEAERLERQLGRTYAALPDDRLAALEQRVGVLETRAEGCITQDEYRARLGALRAAGVVIPSEPVDVAKLTADLHAAQDESIARGELLAARDAEIARFKEERDALMAWRCDVTVALGQPQRTLYADVPKLIREVVADRDRLAKRCADLEQRLSVANKAEAHARAQVDAYHDIGATDRLAALEQRVGAVVGDVARVVGALREYDCALNHPLRGLNGIEPTIACDDDIAALRVPDAKGRQPTPEQQAYIERLCARDAEIAKARGLIKRAVQWITAWVQMTTWPETHEALTADLRAYLAAKEGR